jgi:hypothetical protein
MLLPQMLRQMILPPKSVPTHSITSHKPTSQLSRPRMSFLVTVQFCVSIVRFPTACETAYKVSGPRKECLVNFRKGKWGVGGYVLRSMDIDILIRGC